MSATPADDAQTSPAWNCGCKYTTFFCHEQIKMPFMRIICINGRGSLAYNAILNMSGNGIVAD